MICSLKPKAKYTVEATVTLMKAASSEVKLLFFT